MPLIQDTLISTKLSACASQRGAVILALLGSLGAIPAFAQAQQPEAAKPAPATVAAKEEVTLDIFEFAVEGNTVLPSIDIERAVLPYLGPGRRFQDVESARKALEDTYQRLGYQTVFVDVPEQRVEGGVIRLRVQEGRVERQRVTGSRYFDQGEIRRNATALAEGSVPDFNQVQQQLAQVNRVADRQVAPVLKPGRTPGTVEVELAVKDQLPLHGDLEINNRNSPYTTAARLAGSLRYDNLWQRQHSIGVSYQTSPQDTSEVSVVVGTYLWRFAQSNDVVSLYALKSDSRVALVGSSRVLGDAKIAGARWIVPIESGNALQSSLSAGIDVKNFGQTNIDVQSDSSTVLPSITYAPLSLSVSGAVSRRADVWRFSLGVATAPGGLLGNDDAEFRARRVVASASYLAFKFDLSYERRLSEVFSFWAKTDGQWTGTPLIANEQFAIGGAESVRGYREAELAGDRALRTSAELRYQLLGEATSAAALSAYALAFVDAGLVKLVDPLGPQDPRAGIASVGVGLRVGGWRGLKLSADVARALRDGSLGPGGPVTAKGDVRGLVSLGASF